MKTYWRLIWGIIFLLASVLQIILLFRSNQEINLPPLVSIVLWALLGLILLFKQFRTLKNHPTASQGEIEAYLLGRSQMEIIATLLLAVMIGSIPGWFANDFSAGLIPKNISVIVDIIVNASLLIYAIALYRNNKVLSSLFYAIIIASLLQASAEGWQYGWVASFTNLLTAVYVVFYIKAPLTKKYFRYANYLILPLTFIIPLTLIFLMPPKQLEKCKRHTYYKYPAYQATETTTLRDQFISNDPNYNSTKLIAFGREVTSTIQDNEWGKIVPDQVIISVKWGVSEERVSDLIKSIKGTIITNVYKNQFSIILPCEQDITESINKLNTHPEVSLDSVIIRGDGLPLITINANKWTTDEQVDQYTSEINGTIIGVGFNSRGLDEKPYNFFRRKNFDDEYFDFVNTYLIALPSSTDSNNIRSAIEYFKRNQEIKAAEPVKVHEFVQEIFPS